MEPYFYGELDVHLISDESLVKECRKRGLIKTVSSSTVISKMAIDMYGDKQGFNDYQKGKLLIRLADFLFEEGVAKVNTHKSYNGDVEMVMTLDVLYERFE